jgi:hypothetical protein
MASHQLRDSLYSFVNVSADRKNSTYIENRLREIELNISVRNAVSTCKNGLGIKTTNLSHVTDEEKLAIENCIQKNYLDKNPYCFGNRDTIFLDLNNYN